MAVMMIVPYWSSTDHENVVTVGLIDHSSTATSLLKSDKNIVFLPNETENVDATLEISSSGIVAPQKMTFTYKTSNTSSYDLTRVKILDAISKSKLQFGLEKIRPYKKVDRSKSSDANGVKTFVAYGSAILIYFFIFLYGIQVMKGVIEEKSNRIIEVLITAVKPFNLMIGKIIGIGLLGVSQFIIWGLVYGALYLVFESFYPANNFSDAQLEQMLNTGTSPDVLLEMNTLMNTFSPGAWVSLIGLLLFFFIMGYLIFGALFAIVGAASDVDTETQQFIFPLTVPLLGTLMLSSQILAEPNGMLAKTLSLIPFTSPLTSVMRNAVLIDQEGYWLQLLFSMTCCILGFLATVWAAAKVYRIGILAYGQKIGYKEIFKWITA